MRHETTRLCQNHGRSECSWSSVAVIQNGKTNVVLEKAPSQIHQSSGAAEKPYPQCAVLLAHICSPNNTFTDAAAPKFEDKTLQETLKQERCAQWHLATPLPKHGQCRHSLRKSQVVDSGAGQNGFELRRTGYLPKLRPMGKTKPMRKHRHAFTILISS